MTMKEVCEKYMQFKGRPVEEAQAFWEQSPSGELSHVFAAHEEMQKAGYLPSPKPANPHTGDFYYEGGIKRVWIGNQWIEQTGDRKR